jgi:hypothetical protein
MAGGETCVHEGPVGGHRPISARGKPAQHGFHGYTLRVSTRKVERVTTPGIPIRGWGEPSAHGVQVQVPHQLHKVRVRLAQDGLVAALETVADQAMPLVEVPGVALLEPLHGLGEGKPPWREEQMQMVGHEDIRVQGESVSLLVACQQLTVAAIVRRVPEYGAPLVTPSQHVVERLWNVDTGWTGHGFFLC